MIELNELKCKATATAASPEWSSSTMGRYTDGRWAIGRCVQLEAEAKADAEHIAANSPTVTITLIEIVEAALALRDAIITQKDALRTEHAAQVAYQCCHNLDIMSSVRKTWKDSQDHTMLAVDNVLRSEQALTLALSKVDPVRQ